MEIDEILSVVDKLGEYGPQVAGLCENYGLSFDKIKEAVSKRPNWTIADLQDFINNLSSKIAIGQQPNDDQSEDQPEVVKPQPFDMNTISNLIQGALNAESN